MQTINDAIEWWAADRPDTVALSLSGDSVTYRGLAAWIRRVAARLIDMGVQPGDRVAICSANSLEYCALALAIMRAGAITAPLNVRYTAHELAEIVEDYAPRLIVYGEDAADRFADAPVPTVSMAMVAEVRHGEDARVARPLSPDDAVLIIATSGSTARPKGVVFSHRTMTSYAAAFAIEQDALSPGSGVIIVAPLSTSAGMVQLIHYAILGCSLFLEPHFNAEHFLRILVDEKIAGFGGVPLFFERIAASAGFADADLSNLKIATTGGSRVSRELQDIWAQKGVVIRQIYGQTECGGNATIMPADLAATMPEKCGRGGIFTQLRTVDAEGQDVAPGAPGEILIRGPGVMIGYWNSPDATAAVLRDGWLHTGDIGALDEQGLLTFVDRMKDIIISGGLNVSAAEVERAVAEFPGVEEVAVISARDARFGETPMAVVYARHSIEVRALIEHCNARLADYKVPRYVALEAEPLPRLATQKISKPILREKYRNAHEQLERVR